MPFRRAYWLSALAFIAYRHYCLRSLLPVRHAIVRRRHRLLLPLIFSFIGFIAAIFFRCRCLPLSFITLHCLLSFHAGTRRFR